MKTEEAIQELQQLDDKPILRQCQDCEKWLDESSEIVAEIRDKIEHFVSHGICDECLNNLKTSWKKN